MEFYALQKIILKLMAIISFSIPGDAITTPPTISFVPHEALEKRVCGRPCPALAVFLPRHGILLDDRLDPVNDVNARSILLHELVHYVQWRRAGRQVALNCHEWMAREDEAYRIQYRWLAKSVSTYAGYPVQRRRRIVCTAPKSRSASADAQAVTVAQADSPPQKAD